MIMSVSRSSKQNLGDARKKSIDVLNQEIMNLYKKCKSDGYDDHMLKEITYSLAHMAKCAKWKFRVKQLIYFSLVIVVIAGIIQCNASNRILSVAYKKFMVNHVLPRYDWTWVWNEECILENPYYKPPDNFLELAECDACSSFKSIRKLKDINSTFMTDTIFKKEPVIIIDAMQDWPAMTGSLSLDELSKLYRRSSNLKGYKVCELSVTRGMVLHDETVQELFTQVYRDASKGKDANFTACWRNCHQNSSREIHKFYYQPYFLPGMCEPNRDENFVLAGRKSSVKSKALPFHISATGYWIGQVHGTMEILVKPKKECKDVCHPLIFLLEKGQILSVPSTRLYAMGYRPDSLSAVAIGVGYGFD